ncbi:unnamed protein product [Ilex paraguariensis]|uniref:FBD domain-containing protein n=1 Tax=Ilex paraguariensis TaxID=185542 RepID=A0ABC8UEZ2_9AQUA
MWFFQTSIDYDYFFACSPLTCLTANYLCFDNLTFLELDAGNLGGKWLPNLLDSSPQLKTLVFKENKHSCDDLAPPERVPSCLKFHLKMIEVLKTLNIRVRMTKQEECEALKKLLSCLDSFPFTPE